MGCRRWELDLRRLVSGSDFKLSERGQQQREAIEQRIDGLARSAREPIGVQGCERVLELMQPIQAALDDAGLTFSFG